MRKISFSEATLEAMREEMRYDETVFVMGEDIARQGGILDSSKACRRNLAWNVCVIRLFRKPLLSAPV